MAELWKPNPVARKHAPSLTGELWLQFIDNFPEHDPTPLSGKAKVERRIARKALEAAMDSRMRRAPIYQARFDSLYTGNFRKEDPIEATWGEEIMPFFRYFDAARHEQNTALHREAIYGSYLRILGDVRSQYDRARQNQAGGTLLGEIRGRATELIAGTLIARMRHPNITLVPSLVLQDRFGIPNDNHDYLYIDTYGETPIVQPAQIKTRLNSLEGNTEYFDTIAMLYGDLDLHACNYTQTECKGRAAADCLINKTANYVLHENTAQKTAILDTLTANILIKLSTWDERKEEWLNAINEHRASRFGRSAYTHRGDSDVTFPAPNA